MNDQLDEFLQELENFGQTNDAAGPDRSLRMLNITRDTGEFLAVLINAMQARSILEVGTSNGYSTIWLAMAAAKIGGLVQTIEASDYKVALASMNFERAGLQPWIRQIHADAGQALKEWMDEQFDFVFLDSYRSEYTRWWPDLKRIIRPGGLLVIDNAISHPEELQPLLSILSKDPAFITSLVPVGKGEYLASKVAQSIL